MNMKSNDTTEIIINSPLVAYNKIYELHDFENFYKTIESVSEKGDIPNFKIITEMETFAIVYELFRPNTISYHDIYWGSVTTMDAIYSTLYQFLGSRNLRTFSKFSSPYYYGVVEKITFEEISWISLLKDIEWITNMIKKSIGREALNLYQILDYYSNSFSSWLKYQIVDYIRLEKKNNDIKIEFVNDPYKKIIIDGREILIDKRQSSYSLEKEIFNN